MILIYFLFVLISCETKIQINDIENVDNISYYKENKYTGLAIQEDENGNIRVEEKYNDGIKYSTKLFYTNGSMQSEWIYGNASISVTRFYKSGIVESKENFTKDLVRNGKSVLYYENGNLKSEWNFKNGLRDGLQKNYFGDGKLSDEEERLKEFKMDL